ncbi:hypothetical protein C2I36_04660 [Rhodobacteraceae bacterium WD3A24]|nr:hypothetical protein C2I36_04660 [Rhodobacteraceae bacterium WD3A24]
MARKFGVDLLVQSTGIELSTDEYVAWIDGDVSLGSEVISRMILDEGRVPVPSALLEPCADPQTWQRGQDATQAEVEILWGRDRTALRNCADRHRLLARWAQGQLEESPQ